MTAEIVACPFLTEGRARYCHAAPVRKLILDGPGVTGGRCDSPEYRQCELVAKDSAESNRCPHLEEVRVQYCGASPVTKLVPFSDSQLSCCTSGSHHYCDSYLARANPHATAAPPQLAYAANHFWLDTDDTGLCHIGIDDFLADVVGSVEGIVFATVQGTHRPALTFTICRVEWPMFFPNAMNIQKINSRVRSDTARLTTDPYGTGWLFEGRELPGVTGAGLLSGAEAATWKNHERERLAHEIHKTHAPGCDGGLPVRGVARSLSRPDLICLLQRFFSSSGRLEE
jgi:glycine cleavage system H lipoate-binding protein